MPTQRFDHPFFARVWTMKSARESQALRPGRNFRTRRWRPPKTYYLERQTSGPASRQALERFDEGGVVRAESIGLGTF